MNEQDRNSIKVGDINMNYYRKGNGKKALILIHGNSEDNTIFEDYFQTISDDWKAYAIDMRGHGKTDNGKGSYSIKTMAVDVMRFIYQKPFESVSIVGFSDGANVAMYLTKLAPNIVDKLVLISGNLYVKALSPSFYKKAKLKYKLYRPFMGLSPKAKKITTKMELMLNNIGVYPEDLNHFNLPTLIVSAENDLIDKEHTALIARSIPNSKQITIKGTDHYNLIKSPDLFKEINSFLEQDS